jgi:energy-coupling factor transport system ATP-binding protein
MRGTPFEVPALSDVDITVSQGQITGLVGHTGSGKSTLMQHFNGLLRPQAGDPFSWWRTAT